MCYYGPKELTFSLTYIKPKITANKVEARGTQNRQKCSTCEKQKLLSQFKDLRNRLGPWSRAARKWTENEDMKRKWRENEEMNMKLREYEEMERKFREKRK